MAADIRHVVVLMLENRSFDSMLGTLYTNRPGFAGLNGTQSNRYLTGLYPASSNVPANANAFTVPTPDPGEQFTDITEQIFGESDGHARGLPPAMSGFAQNYARQTAEKAYHDPHAVMYHYTAKQLPVLHALAKAYGVSDQWFASAPCQTWPNRFFAHCGTCHGIVDNNKFFGHGEVPFRGRSIFGALEKAGKPWRVYFHDMPQSVLLADIELVAPLHYHLFSQFLVDAAQGQLPAYSFIEPQYFGDFFASQPPNDQHPPHDVSYADQLTADVYNAVRNSPCWMNTLLIVTYDEHGGCYDHVPPPAAMPPDGAAPFGYSFNTYGVRVPAVIISPWIKPGSLLQPLAGGGPYPFDHTSIIKTLRELHGLEKLTERDEAAPSLLPFLTLPAPTNNGPEEGTPRPRPKASRAELWQMGQALANDLHKALGQAAEMFETEVKTAGRELGSVAETVAQVGTRAAAQVRAFLHML